MSFRLKLTHTIAVSPLYRTIDLNDFSGGYTVAPGWAPKIAKQTRSLLAGRPAYEKVIETIPITIYGATKDQAAERLNGLIKMIDQAARWAAGETVLPYLNQYESVKVSCVRLQYSHDSAGTLWEAPIYGSPEQLDTLIGLNPDYNARLEAFVIGPVNLTLSRGGLWIDPTPDTVTQTAVNSGTATILDLGSEIDYFSPTRITFKNYRRGFSNYPIYQDAIILVKDREQSVSNPDAYIYDASDFTAAGAWADFNDSANNPTQGTNVKRFTPTGTSYTALNTTGLSSQDINAIQGRFAACYGVLRNNSAVDFMAYAVVDQGGKGRPVIIPPANNQPQIVNFGIFGANSNRMRLETIYAKPETTTGSPTLDLDAVLMVIMDTQDAVIKLRGPAYNASGAVNLIIEPGYTQLNRPLVQFYNITVNYLGITVPFLGGAFISSKFRYLRVCVLAPSENSWRLAPASPGTGLQTFDIEISRNEGRLAPE